jgi:ribosome-associated protein
MILTVKHRLKPSASRRLAALRPQEPVEGSEPLSKTQRKKASDAVQALGEMLVSIEDYQLKKLDLDEVLLDAVMQARSIRAHEGRRRQLQYIGKLMRSRDIEPLRLQLLDRDVLQKQENARMHAAEQWRIRLLGEPASLELWLATYCEAAGRDEIRLKLSVMIQAAQAPASPGQLKAFRELYRVLHAGLLAHEQATLPEALAVTAEPTID